MTPRASEEVTDVWRNDSGAQKLEGRAFFRLVRQPTQPSPTLMPWLDQAGSAERRPPT